MEWQVYLVIVSLIGFCVAVVTPIIKLNTSIVKLNEALNRIDANLSDLSSSNKTQHDKIYSRLDDHEKRITVLEVKEEV